MPGWQTSPRTPEITHMPGEVREDRVIRHNQVFFHVAVGRNDSVYTDSLKEALGPGAPGYPAHEHYITVGRVLDRFRAEVGDEVEQIDDPFGIRLRSTNWTRSLRPVPGNLRQGDRRHPCQHTILVWVKPRFSPIFDPVRTADGRLIGGHHSRKLRRAGCFIRRRFGHGHGLVSSVSD